MQVTSTVSTPFSENTDMTRTSINPGIIANRDTVEEFWSLPVLDQCRAEARDPGQHDFLDEMSSFLGASGKLWPARRASIALQHFLQVSVPKEKNLVLMSGFNCRDVMDAVVRAGLTVNTFDFADETGKIDWQSVATQLTPRHGALIIPHFFGVPTDFRPVISAARGLGTLIVEDCAHTFGAKIGAATAGTLGDAAIYSFNYDKPISLGGGGLLLVNNADLWHNIRLDEPAGTLEREVEELSIFLDFLSRRRSTIRDTRLQSIYKTVLGKASSLMRPRKHPYEMMGLFPISGIGPLRATLGLWQLRQYNDIIKRRNVNAARFANIPGCKSWHVGADIHPAWLKQKVILRNPREAKRMAASLQRRGLRVGNFNWPVTMEKIMGLPEKPFTGFAAKYGLDVPVHQNMTAPELDFIRDTIYGN
jgi:dTDP-4-amino-4,6-dideoxygalactose transaminase